VFGDEPAPRFGEPPRALLSAYALPAIRSAASATITTGRRLARRKKPLVRAGGVAARLGAALARTVRALAGSVRG
jgi:hypothetical protein